MVYRMAVLGVIVVGILFIKLTIEKEKTSIRSSLTNAADQMGKIISYDIDYVRYQLDYASHQIADMNGDKEKIQKLLATFSAGTSNQIDVTLTWNAFSWIDGNNMLSVDGTSGILSKALSMTHRDYLKLTPYNGGQLIFGQPVYGALSQRLIIPVGIGVSSRRDIYLGTLVFGFDIEKIITKLEKTIGNSAISFVFLHDGKYIFGSENFSHNNIDFIEKNYSKLDSSTAGDGKAFSFNGIFSENHSEIYFKKLKNYPLQIVVSYDQNVYHENLINSVLKQILFILIVILSCIILFNKIHKKIVNPVTKLSILAQKISEGDFSYNVEEPEAEELQDLLEALMLLKNSFEREAFLVEQLKLANQKIAQENFNKSDFLSAISHDIRNPLAAIISFSQFIKDGNAESESSRKELAQDIENCALDALQFITDLMDVNQAASGEFSINMSHKINIVETIARSIRINRDFAVKRNIEIINHTNPNLPLINLDQRRIKQIIVNLVNNSVKYSKEKTQIEIEAKEIVDDLQRKLQITIQDQGFGMSEQEVEKAMKKYSTIENENSNRIDSFGLGLPLVKQLVELQNGTIKIESKSGIGTKIILKFAY